MELVFDPRPTIAQRELLDPISTPVPAEFPHAEELPEGCHLLKDLHH